MKLLKEYKEGAKVYQCNCGHKFTVPKGKKEIKCLYCGKEEESIIDKYLMTYYQKIKNAITKEEVIEIIDKIYEDGFEDGKNE